MTDTNTEKRVTVYMKSKGTGDLIHMEMPVSRAISMIKTGEATYHGPLEDSEKAHQQYLTGDMDLEEKINQIQASLSFLDTHKPKIERFVRIIQIVINCISFNWKIFAAITSVGSVMG